MPAPRPPGNTPFLLALSPAQKRPIHPAPPSEQVCPLPVPQATSSCVCPLAASKLRHLTAPGTRAGDPAHGGAFWSRVWPPAPPRLPAADTKAPLSLCLPAWARAKRPVPHSRVLGGARWTPAAPAPSGPLSFPPLREEPCWQDKLPLLLSPAASVRQLHVPVAASITWGLRKALATSFLVTGKCILCCDERPVQCQVH